MNIKETFLKVIDTEIEEISKVRNSFDDSIINIINVLIECKGKVVLCGMGKPGHIGRKISATMSSLGIHSTFLHPGEAMHGDLGLLTSDDIIIMISNSGMTSEICNIIPNIKLIGSKIIAITSGKDSDLAHYADFCILLPEINEACSLNLAPTSSTTVELVIGDAIAVTLSELCKFKKEDFALYHPAGSLGRKLLTRVSDIMHSEIKNPTVRNGETIKNAIVEITVKGLGAVNIIDSQGNMLGIVTDGDIRRCMEKGIDIYTEPVDKIMTTRPIFATPTMLAIDALKLMEEREKQLSVLPVIDENKKSIGLIRMHDVILKGILL